MRLKVLIFIYTAVSREAWAKLRDWASVAGRGRLLLSGSVAHASLKTAKDAFEKLLGPDSVALDIRSALHVVVSGLSSQKDSGEGQNPSRASPPSSSFRSSLPSFLAPPSLWAQEVGRP